MAEVTGITQNGKDVLDAIIAMGGHKPGQEVTLHEIADSMGVTWQKVNGALTSLDRNYGLIERVEATVTEQDEDGNDVEKAVKHIVLTDAALAGDYTVREAK